MNDRTRGQQLPRQQTGMWVAEDREEIKEREGAKPAGWQPDNNNCDKNKSNG